jgi:hypothetical protein
MANKSEPLDWLRAKKDETIISIRTTWETRCRNYKVQESVGKLTGMGTVYFAMYDNTILSRHRKKRPALGVCEKHARQVARKAKANT